MNQPYDRVNGNAIHPRPSINFWQITVRSYDAEQSEAEGVRSVQRALYMIR